MLRVFLALVDRGSNWSGNNGSIRVDSSSCIADISNIAIIVVGAVVHCLGAAIGESHRVGASLDTKTVRSLTSLEVGGGVVISHGVVEVVGRDLSKGVSIGGNSSGVGNDWASSISGGSMNNRGSISRGSMGNHWASSVGRGSMDNRGGMGDHWASSIGGGSMNDRGSICRGSIGRGSMGYQRTGSITKRSSMCDYRRPDSSKANINRPEGSKSRLDLLKTLGVVKLGGGGMGGSEGLGLDKTPDLLAWPGH